MSANVGVALSLVTQPDVYADPDFSTRVRDAVHAQLLATDEPAPARHNVLTALQLSALLRSAPARGVTPAKAALLQQWLERLASHSAS